VLILTAADSVDERVKGLDLGADDYMAKPFALRARGARARADAARRGRRPDRRAPRLARVRPGRPHRLCERADARLSRASSGCSKCCCSASAGSCRATLVDHLCEWGEEVSNNAIEVYVHRLRKKIEPAACASPPCAASATASRKPRPRRRPTRLPLRRARGGRHAAALSPAVAAEASPVHSRPRPANNRPPPTPRAMRATRTRSRR
jgi:CheY-like chemotaxis protein